MLPASRHAPLIPMTSTHDDAARAPETRHPGLVSRLLGVLFSPRDTFGAVVARPRWLGAIVVVALVMAGASGWLVSTEVGQQAALEQQVSAMESFGVTVSPLFKCGAVRHRLEVI